jgi:DNA-binding winged helix-turn-helix (wHTH) protein
MQVGGISGEDSGKFEGPILTIRFASFELDTAQRRLTGNGADIHLTPKAFELLAFLVAEAPRVVPKEELHHRLWPNTFVADATLVGLVKELRRALRGGVSDPPVIRTAHGIGYALATPVIRARAPRPAMRHWIVAGHRRIVLTEGNNVIGRDPAAAVALDAPGVSRRHAQIVLGENGAILEDLGSKNGTRIRDTPIQTRVRLHDGDRIQVGPVLISYHAATSGLSTETLTGSRVT